MIWFSTSNGNGTSPNKKHSGKRTRREAREPKHSTNAPIHETTSAIILIESLTSEGSEADQINVEHAINSALATKTEPVRTPGTNIVRRDRHSRKIRAALTGRIRRM
jgi:hypothetical protein